MDGEGTVRCGMGVYSVGLSEHVKADDADKWLVLLCLLYLLLKTLTSCLQQQFVTYSCQAVRQCLMGGGQSLLR